MNRTPEETLRSYVSAFETLSPDAMVPFYLLPCMFIAPQGVTVVGDAGAARALASKLIEHARSQGYKRTEIVDLQARRLSESLASLSGVFVRLGAGGEEIGRFGFSYILVRGGEDWRITVALAHEAPTPS